MHNTVYCDIKNLNHNFYINIIILLMEHILRYLYIIMF